MNIPAWVKPGAYGVALGAAALAIAGFSWGGWVTGSTASKMASEQARMEVVAALVPICIEQSKKDPMLAEKIASLKTAKYYDRNDVVMNTGWATMPGTKNPNSQVAAACVEKLAAAF